MTQYRSFEVEYLTECEIAHLSRHPPRPPSTHLLISVQTTTLFPGLGYSWNPDDYLFLLQLYQHTAAPLPGLLSSDSSHEPKLFTCLIEFPDRPQIRRQHDYAINISDLSSTGEKLYVSTTQTHQLRQPTNTTTIQQYTSIDRCLLCIRNSIAGLLVGLREAVTRALLRHVIELSHRAVFRSWSIKTCPPVMIPVLQDRRKSVIEL